jgi:hypothetical protein
MFAILIIILSLWVLTFIISIVANSEFGLFSFVLISGVWFGFFIMAVYDSYHPTAMDVYRNKTTLEITYKDSIPVDSTVVFK